MLFATASPAEQPAKISQRPLLTFGEVYGRYINDPTRGDAVEEVLLSHREAASDRFRGIRDMVCPNPLRGE